MKLFQYWDSPPPPPEVAAWIEGFRTRNPEFEHSLFDREAGARFIADRYGPRELAAFEACAAPAMQADYLRLCLMDCFGGLYADADFQSLQPLSSLIARAPRSMMLTWEGHVVTGFILFRRPHDPFIRACLKLATENIEARRFGNVYNATGPGILNAIRALIDPASLPVVLKAYDNPLGRRWAFPELLEHARASIVITPELAAAFRDISLMRSLDALPWLGTEQPAYKKTERHWLHWEGPLYRDAAAEGQAEAT